MNRSAYRLGILCTVAVSNRNADTYGKTLKHTYDKIDKCGGCTDRRKAGGACKVSHNDHIGSVEQKLQNTRGN